MASSERSSVRGSGTGIWVAFFSAAVVALAAQSATALDATMSLEGITQGEITCDTNVQEGREGTFPVLAFGYSIDVPLDTSTGGRLGGRQHKPVSVRLDAGCSGVPNLYSAVFSNERLAGVTIRFYRRGQDGQVEHYFTVALEDAVILGITAAGAGPQGETQLLVSFSFRRISLTYEVGGVEAQDDWSEPKL